MRIAAVAACLLLGCGGASAPPQQQPISNTAPVQDPPPARRTSDCGCSECSMSPKIIASFCRYSDAICTCQDIACMTKAGEAWSLEAVELSKLSSPKPDEMTDADKAFFEKGTKRITECTVKLTEELMKSTGGAGSGGTP